MGQRPVSEELLAGLDPPARAARRELLEGLIADGVGDEELRTASAEGRLLFLAAERAVGGGTGELFSAHEMARRSGMHLDFLIALRRAHGLPVADADARVYSEADVSAAQMAVAFREAGVADEQMLSVVRVIGPGLSRAAEAMRSTVLELVLEPGAGEAELARLYAQRVAELLPMIGPMMDAMLRMHLRHTVRTEAINAAERARGSLPGARDVTVCFADLVGFTRLGEDVAPEQLGATAERMARLAAEVVREELRLIKTIGDAAMFVSPDPGPLVDVALDLIVASDAEGEDFPQLRVGVASGEALSRGGDWYGRPVNLASRITAIARPGSVLTTREVREAVGDDLRWSAAGRRTIRGLDRPVALFRARRPDAGGDGASQREESGAT